LFGNYLFVAFAIISRYKYVNYAIVLH